MAITTLDELRSHLQIAIEVEHATIPPYLTALYSILPGRNRECIEVIVSVVVEEMLHLTLAANLLNAVGGEPALGYEGFVPNYPTYLPHSADVFLVPLAPFSRETIDTFMKIEYPEADDARPEDDLFETLGQFYRAIEDGFETLCAELGESAVFCGDPARQITSEVLDYDRGGTLIPVYDLASARAAIDEIEEQGEGLKRVEIWDGDRDIFHPEREEVAHYFRFNEIAQGRSYCRGDTPGSGPSGDPFEVDWDAVYPMKPNCRAADFPEGTPVREAMDRFNQRYSDLLRVLDRAFNGEPQEINASFEHMMGLREAAHALFQLPVGDGPATAGPSFEYMPPAYGGLAVAVPFSVRVEKDGPYVVDGGIPLVRKSIVYSEWGEPMTWRKEQSLPSRATYRLCRCGQSAHKPFCDSSHLRVGFDGTETASVQPSSERQVHTPGTGMVVSDDRLLCAQAGFCGNRFRKVWQMMADSGDSQVRFEAMHRTELCPSGRLTYSIEENGLPIEPDLPQEIGVVRDGPYWVTGGIRVTLSDGQDLEIRNRVTLCRCGQSSNKPLCDGTHNACGFKDG